MIGISKLYLGTVEPGDPLRYGRDSSRMPSGLLQFSRDKKPVVVWNVTRACNLKCVHCYADAAGRPAPGELTTAEGKALLEDLSGFGVPVVLFSGGEPLVRPDILHLLEYSVKLGIRTVLSTNGTLIDRAMADRLAGTGLSYVGVSLDGIGELNDRFRGVEGAFDRAMAAIEYLSANRVKVGLRFTMTRSNVDEIPRIFDLIEDRKIPRVCFYHLVYTGRGSSIADQDLGPESTRRAVDLIIDRTVRLFQGGHRPEVLTVDNHADGVYLYLRLLAENPGRAEKVLSLLKMNGGNSSGLGIASVGWDGTIYPDQFWRNHPLGNVREEPFSRVWGDPAHPLLRQLRERKRYLKGRCRTCPFLDICNGNFRARAEASTGDPWAPDPACYLSDEELNTRKLSPLTEAG